ncbi:hypothetical protein [Gryllotalpicola sp.]|uniref:hypothetical protein n=1 Tax=Gryllotalpicola sp. TaxID=1932787 RepID=UPI002637C986|nr:hypothetical protein [Gryllotalpicola sp.]
MSRRDAHLSLDDRTRDKPAFVRHFPAIERAVADGHDVIGGLAPLLFPPLPPRLPPEYLRPFHVDVSDALDAARDDEHRRVVVKRVLEEVLSVTAYSKTIGFAPTALVDFVWRIAAELLDHAFGSSLFDADLVDPFAGIGVFADRLIRVHGVGRILNLEMDPEAAKAARLIIGSALAAKGLRMPVQFRADEATLIDLPRREGIRVIVGNPPRHGSLARTLSWAGEQLGERGLTAFILPRTVTSSQLFAQRRDHFQRDFDQIYVLDLRGERARTPTARASAGGNVFGAGGAGGASVVFSVRGARRQPVLSYHADGASREEKLAWIGTVGELADIPWALATE